MNRGDALDVVIAASQLVAKSMRDEVAVLVTATSGPEMATIRQHRVAALQAHVAEIDEAVDVLRYGS